MLRMAGNPNWTEPGELPNVTNDGGFRIDIRPDELTVTPDTKAWRNKTNRRWSIAFRIFLYCIVGLVLVGKIATSNHPVEMLLVLALVIGLSYVDMKFAKQKAIHCTRDSIEVIEIVRGKERDKRSYAKTEVGEIRYAPVAYSRYSSVNGILFNVAGKKVKALSGLECPEADTILKAFERLGYSVFHDVGMPMLVEIALERRNSRINLH